MQAFANEVAEKVDSTKSSAKTALDSMEDRTSLFTAGEIIFPDENVDRPYTRYGYKIGKLNFLVPEFTVSEVIQKSNIFNLPNSPSWIEGLINIRGNIIPIMNIARLLKLPNNKAEQNILLLGKSDSNKAIGVMINDLPVSLEIGESNTKVSEYPEILQDFIKNGFYQNNTDWIEFEPQELFKKLADK